MQAILEAQSESRVGDGNSRESKAQDPESEVGGRKSQTSQLKAGFIVGSQNQELESKKW